MRLAAISLFALVAVACTAEDSGDAVDTADDAEIVSSGKDDPRFTVRVDRTWLLRGDARTPSDRELVVRITAPSDVTRMRAQIDTGRTVSATRAPDGTFTFRLPIDAVATGQHTLLLAQNYGYKSVATRTFQITAPLYVVVSTDWDDTRFSDRELARMGRLSDLHPQMLLTHFFAPFHYTDPMVSPARKVEIEQWIKKDRDTRKSELGVHIHTWCHFVVAAGVKCHPQPAFAPNDESGYVTILASYSQSEMAAMLRKSVEIFDEHDLGRPRSFRAGGWTADLSTLRALESEGFTVDTSALPFKRIEEWRGYVLYTWNEKNWLGITETSQPYFPSNLALTSTAEPTKSLSILEVPDNGILVDYVSGAEMIGIYEQNAPSGKALTKPTLFQVGYHPPNFSDIYLARLDQALGHVDKNLYSQDKGPAIYVTISELTKVWKR